MPIEPYPTLPDEREVGSAGEWRLPTDDGGALVRGALLGIGASRRYRHKHDGEFVQEGGRCSACRWFEVRIFKTDEAALTTEMPNGDVLEERFGTGYLLHFAGKSVVPGEVTRYRTEWTSSGFDVLEALTTRRDGGRDAYLTAPAARALAQGASYDPSLKEAYVERAVS